MERERTEHVCPLQEALFHEEWQDLAKHAQIRFPD